MKTVAKRQISWVNFLKFYSDQNKGRPTRLGVFDNGNDYWLEDGLILTGIDFDTRRNAIEIMLSDEITHTIHDVKKVEASFSLDEINDGLDITDFEGTITILRFEEK